MLQCVRPPAPPVVLAQVATLQSYDGPAAPALHPVSDRPPYSFGGV